MVVFDAFQHPVVRQGCAGVQALAAVVDHVGVGAEPHGLEAHTRRGGIGAGCHTRAEHDLLAVALIESLLQCQPLRLLRLFKGAGGTELVVAVTDLHGVQVGGS